MTKIKKVTAALLKNYKACSSEVERFNREFPGGADITLDNCHKAVTCDFNILWFASHCLPVPLWKAYEEGEAPLWKAYEEGIAPLWKAYEEGEAPLWKAYEEGKAPLWKAYEEGKAQLLYRILKKGG